VSFEKQIARLNRHTIGLLCRRATCFARAAEVE
jgi:hypothetical protein